MLELSRCRFTNLNRIMRVSNQLRGQAQVFKKQIEHSFTPVLSNPAQGSLNPLPKDVISQTSPKNIKDQTLPRVLFVTDINGTLLHKNGFDKKLLEVIRKWSKPLQLTVMLSTGKGLPETLNGIKKCSEQLKDLEGVPISSLGSSNGRGFYRNDDKKPANVWLSNLTLNQQDPVYKRKSTENLAKWDLLKVQSIIHTEASHLPNYLTTASADPKFYLKASPEQLTEVEQLLIPNLIYALKKVGINADVEIKEMTDRSDEEGLCKKYLVIPAGVDKSTSLKHAITLENISHVITTGNGPNDIPMFRLPEFGKTPHTALIYNGKKKGLDKELCLKQPHCIHLDEKEPLSEALDKTFEKIHKASISSTNTISQAQD
jgi:hydroxymethylpyrimidine pyrophosphatase-like HAD family hydrolase